MRKIQAIALLMALIAAPMALFAGAWDCAGAPGQCTMACCRNSHCVMPQKIHCAAADSLMCDCGQAPPLVMLAPLTQMILPHAVSRPGVAQADLDPPRTPESFVTGFLPSPFHPPRG